MDKYKLDIKNDLKFDKTDRLLNLKKIKNKKTVDKVKTFEK